jgi:hypothetical protein
LSSLNETIKDILRNIGLCFTPGPIGRVPDAVEAFFAQDDPEHYEQSTYLEGDQFDDMVPAPGGSRVLVADIGGTVEAKVDITGDYIQAGFARFHTDNPHVYEKLVELALQAKANGHKSIGIGLLWERMRWFNLVETTGDTYALNNNYRSRYARLIMSTVPALDGFFKTRALY